MTVFTGVNERHKASLRAWRQVRPALERVQLHLAVTFISEVTKALRVINFQEKL